MKYLAAYMLCQLGGNKKPQADDIVKILSSVGIEADRDRLQLVLDKLKDVNADDAIEQGRAKLASIPSGGGGGGGAAAPAAAAAGAPAGGADKGGKPAAAAPAKKEEPKEEEEGDDDMGFGLFD